VGIVDNLRGALVRKKEAERIKEMMARKRKWQFGNSSSSPEKRETLSGRIGGIALSIMSHNNTFATLRKRLERRGLSLPVGRLKNGIEAYFFFFPGIFCFYFSVFGPRAYFGP